MSTSINNQFDAIEQMIFVEGLRIQAMDIQPELDIMIIYLNTKAVISQNISTYPMLKSAEIAQLKQYEIIGGGTGIHWPMLDEDLSLKGFLQDALRKVVKGKNEPLAA